MSIQYNSNNGQNNTPDWFGWILTIICLGVFPPVGLFLLFRQLMGYSKGQRRRVKRHPYDIQQEWDRNHQGHPYNARQSWEDAQQQKNDRAQAQQQGQAGGPVWNERTAQWEGGAANAKQGWSFNPGQRHGASQGGQQAAQGGQQQGAGRQGWRYTPPKPAPVDVRKGKGLVIAGSVIAAVFGLASLSVGGELLWDLFYYGWMPFWEELMPFLFSLGLTGAGIITLLAGRSRQKKAKRYKQYLALIGQNTSISILTLARNMEMSIHDVCDDLQDMLDTGILPTGYLDIVNGRLVLSEEGYVESRKQEDEEQAESASTPEDDNQLLGQIRAVNDAIADPVMSAKIDRIGEITSKILDYQRKHPNKDSQLRSFLNYYLPTTMKILHAYSQLEAQGIEGENISAAKDRIEGMMDKVVEGFEKQLDKLFQDEAMDITSDVAVLESMLQKDGLSGEGITLEI